ncbi:hypothetical protein AN958_09630, partial [Leucoagaricus sp. SymC.cos]
KPCIMCNLQHSDTTTIWFDVWDSQSGASAKKLKNQHMSINNAHCLIQLAKAHSGIPQCQCCWCWRHPSNTYKTQVIKCLLCTGPHSEAHHRKYCGTCKGNAKATPPIPPTEAGIPCPHNSHCINCKSKHMANNCYCKYWHHRFDTNWFIHVCSGSA